MYIVDDTTGFFEIGLFETLEDAKSEVLKRAVIHKSLFDQLSAVDQNTKLFISKTTAVDGFDPITYEWLSEETY